MALPNTTLPKTTATQRKRLIVLCDGTWQDSTASDDKEYPSNVTRLSRAISPYADVKNADGTIERVQQIIYYQKGLGTGVMDQILSGGTGIGLSANVRAAYGFLAHNYQPGDQIYFFGFSRGAFTARAIAGLVTAYGLLTKKGMDSFSTLYNALYTEQEKDAFTCQQEEAFMMSLESKGLLQPKAASAVEIIGVFDTVAFHKPGFSRSFFARAFGLKPEYIEFKNSELSDKVTHGFHALALDETRKSFLPLLWEEPTKTQEHSDANGSTHTHAQEPRPQQHISQVWFSGVHTDIGGGRRDHRLSDITLAWMISKCTNTGLLEFDTSYLSDANPSTSADVSSLNPPSLWATFLGATTPDAAGFMSNLIGFVTRLFGKVVRPVLVNKNKDTFEKLHSSIRDRKLSDSAGIKGAIDWPCAQIASSAESLNKDGPRVWNLTSGSSLSEEEALPTELNFKGQIRTAKNELPPMQSKESAKKK